MLGATRIAIYNDLPSNSIPGTRKICTNSKLQTFVLSGDQNSCQEMSLFGEYDATRSQSSPPATDQGLKPTGKCMAECAPSTSGTVSLYGSEGELEACEIDYCASLESLPSDWFTRTDSCYQLGEYSAGDENGGYREISIEQDTTQIQEL